MFCNTVDTNILTVLLYWSEVWSSSDPEHYAARLLRIPAGSLHCQIPCLSVENSKAVMASNFFSNYSADNSANFVSYIHRGCFHKYGEGVSGYTVDRVLRCIWGLHVIRK